MLLDNNCNRRVVCSFGVSNVIFKSESVAKNMEILKEFRLVVKSGVVLLPEGSSSNSTAPQSSDSS